MSVWGAQAGESAAGTAPSLSHLPSKHSAHTVHGPSAALMSDTGLRPMVPSVAWTHVGGGGERGRTTLWSASPGPPDEGQPGCERHFTDLPGCPGCGHLPTPMPSSSQARPRQPVHADTKSIFRATSGRYQEGVGPFTCDVPRWMSRCTNTHDHTRGGALLSRGKARSTGTHCMSAR